MNVLQRSPLPVVPGIIAGVALALALLTMARPVMGLAAILVVLGLGLVIGSALARLCFLIFGALLVLGSSTEVSGGKILYAAMIIAVAGVSMANLAREPPGWFPRVKLWLTLTLLFGSAMIISTLAAPGADVTSVVRQGLFYILIPLAPLIGVETGRHLQPRTVTSLTAAAGALSAVGFAVDWLTRRGVAAFDLPYLVLGSTVLAGLAFALAIVLVNTSKGLLRVMWAAIAALIPLAMLVTGTRTNLVLFVVILGMLGTAAKLRLPPVRAMVAAGVIVAAVGLLLPTLAEAVLSDQTFLDKRLEALLRVLSGDAGEDQSYQWRALQYGYAWEQIDQRPWLGHGLGWNPPFAMDTPLVTVVKLGVVGTGLLVAYLIASMAVVERLAQWTQYSPIHTAARGVGLLILALIPFGSPLEDRGFPLALALVFAGVASVAETKGAPLRASSTEVAGCAPRSASVMRGSSF